LHLSDTSHLIDFIVEENASKVGRYVTKSRVPVLPSGALALHRPDYCMILPMRSKRVEQDLMLRHRQFERNGGRFVELFPENLGDASILDPVLVATLDQEVI
jgi:hypothetical protein